MKATVACRVVSFWHLELKVKGNGNKQTNQQMRLVKPNWRTEAQMLTLNEGWNSAHQEAAVSVGATNIRSKPCLVPLIVTEGQRWMFGEKVIRNTSTKWVKTPVWPLPTACVAPPGFKTKQPSGSNLLSAPPMHQYRSSNRLLSPSKSLLRRKKTKQKTTTRFC